ncbi:hypothetical protein E5221_28400 [Pseudomonas sp. A2]|nr:hypothetical protein E5221_28400 [Pseudomonas sp. A2]
MSCRGTHVGAGSPANTGEAGAIHRVAFFAGKPAPTAAPLALTGRNPPPLPAGIPLPAASA